MDHGAHSSGLHGHEEHQQPTTGMSHGEHGSHEEGKSGTCILSEHTMMPMYFHAGSCVTVLFYNWQITSNGSLVGSVIGIFIMAALYEGLKYYREYLFWRTYNALQYKSVSMPAEKNRVSADNRIFQPTMFSLMHGFQTFLHVIQIVLSYFLMLIFMTYNIWLCLAVVLGAATGYFLFGWKKSIIVDVTEHCH